MTECRECGETKHVYYGGTFCASCGWHARGQTTTHADFRPDPECRWCNTEGTTSE